MTDTHDNGREEQWEKRQGDLPEGVSYLDSATEEDAILAITTEEYGEMEWLMPAVIIDVILEARAQAGLAQRYREALGRIELRTHGSAANSTRLSLSRQVNEIARDVLSADREETK